MNSLKIVSSDCQIVQGYLRNAIYDLTRQKYYLLQAFSDISELDEQVIAFLEKEEILITVPSNLKNAFPPIDLNYQTNQVISACQIRYFGGFDITKILKLNCRDFSIVINCFDDQKKEMKNLLDELLKEPINSVQLHLTDNSLTESNFLELKDIVLNYSFCIAYVYDAYYDYNFEQNDLILNISFLSRTINDMCNNFYINIKSFTEAQNKNLFYNQFLFIDDEGKIKNSLFTSVEFDSISNVDSKLLGQIVSSREFNYLWDVSKDMIDICKDCEFRYMCCDDRLPIKRNDKEWYYEQECNYNPYICKWQGEDDYLPLEECGVISNEHKYSIDHERIAKINQKLWEE